MFNLNPFKFAVVLIPSTIYWILLSTAYNSEGWTDWICQYKGSESSDELIYKS